MSVKGLHKIIYPFAPDQSGATAVLYEMGGMIIVVDAGGCAGNICGFDEPRWPGMNGAVFSAGLRDMDAILGRDDLMIEKITKASKKIDAAFVALIGTPVPATIATDYRALRRMAEKRTGLPVITVDSNGACWYDAGIEKAYLELFRRFAESGSGEDDKSEDEGFTGVLGAVPLDTGCPDAPERIRAILKAEGTGSVVCYGERAGSAGNRDAAEPLSGFRNARLAEKNIVVSAAGLAAARYLEGEYGIPYECRDLLAEEALDRAVKSAEACGTAVPDLAGRRVLIIHQQIRANTLRDIMRISMPGAESAHIDAATWFMLDDEIKEEGDFRIKEEQDFFDIAEKGGYDMIMVDPSFRKAAKGFGGIFVDLPHFAVSGTLA